MAKAATKALAEPEIVPDSAMVPAEKAAPAQQGIHHYPTQDWVDEEGETQTAIVVKGHPALSQPEFPTGRNGWTVRDTEDNMVRFLESYIETFSIVKSCKTTGIGRTTVYKWKARVPAFKNALIACKEHSLDVVEDSLFERAKKRDTLAAIILLKHNRPDIYHERSHTVHTGPQGGPIQVANWVDLITGGNSGKDSGGK